MNILFLTGSFYPQVGGVEKSVYCIARELTANNYNVTIITQKKDKSSLSYEIFPEGFSVYRIPIIKIPKTGVIQKWLWILFHIKLVFKSDIIHFHDFDVLIKWFFPFRFIFFNKKYFITFHGYEGFPIRFKHILYRKIAEKITVANICVGDFIKRWYRTKPDKIYYAAVDYPDETQNTEERNDIFFIGRLEKDTDILNYIQAIKLFNSKKMYKFCFKILGDGSLKNRIISFLEENNIPYNFLGFKDSPIDFLKTAKVVLASSYLSIIESLALGKIVISFYSNNLKRDYLKSFPGADSIFFIYEDIKHVSNRIEDIFKNPDKYEKYRIEGKKLAKEMSWKKVSERYISLYNKYLKNES